jgi:hypothetical protein
MWAVRCLTGVALQRSNISKVSMKKVPIKSYIYLAAAVGTFVALLYASPDYFKQYWPAFLLAWALTICALIVLWAKRLKHELDLSPWRKQAAAIDPQWIDRSTAEGQRQWLVWLYAREDYDEAAEHAATVSDEALIDAPCEELADKVKSRRPEVARRLYKAAMEYYRWEGMQATGSGEGLMAIDAMKRLEGKLKKVKG